MSLAREKVVEYYDQLKNQIDIKSERLLLRNKDQEDRENINALRAECLQAIDDVLTANLDQIERNKISSSDCEAEIFAPKFCFLNFSKKKCEDSFFGQQLVITNQFVPEAVRDQLNGHFDYEPSPEEVLYQTLFELIESSTEDDIIDLSTPSDNQLEELELRFNLANKPNCLDLLPTLLNTDELKTLKIEINYLRNEGPKVFNLHRGIFSCLTGLTNLVINSTKETEFEEGCLDGLTSLEELLIDGRKSYKTFHMANLNKLNTLNKVGIHSMAVKTGELNLPNLKFITLRRVNLDKLGGFILDNLAGLDLSDTWIDEIDNEVFKGVKNLTYLNMCRVKVSQFDVDCLNGLDKLEFLKLGSLKEAKCELEKIENLRLPSLKYLAVDSEVVPRFKNLSLQYLRLGEVEEFEPKNLLNQPNLIGLYLISNFKLISDLGATVFSDLKSLAHFEFVGSNVDKLDKEFCKSLINRSNVNFSKHPAWGNGFMVSAYKNIKNLMFEGLSFSNDTKEAMQDNFNYYWRF